MIVCKSLLSHHEVSMEICTRKMKIECSRQVCAGRTDTQTDRVTPRAPVGAKNVFLKASLIALNVTPSLELIMILILNSNTF